MRHSRGLVFAKNFISNWSQSLLIAQRIINSTIHESIDCTPAQILFGDAIDLENNIFLPPAERPPLMHIPQWRSEKLSIHDAIIKRAQQIQRFKDNTHMSTIQPQLTTYNVDQFVLIEYPSSTQHT